jgi:AraC-like DNA-binding protein
MNANIPRVRKLRSSVRPDDASWHLLSHDFVDGKLAPILGAQAADSSTLGAQIIVPSLLGQGVWRFIALQDGVSVMLADLEYKEDRHIEVPGEHLIKIRIMLSGQLKTDKLDIHIDGTGAYLEYYSPSAGGGYVLSGGSPVKMVVISILPEKFSEIIKFLPEEIPDILYPLVEPESSISKSINIRIGPELSRAANDMLYSLTIIMPRLVRSYLYAKAIEILSVLVTQIDRLNDAPLHHVKATPRDMDRIYQARDILYQNYCKPPTIPSLARIVGINQTKLKSLFRITFDMTVGDFIQKRRMEKALELLHDFDLSIAQIAYEVGYSHPANFSAVFKRFYGHLPRDARTAGGYMQCAPE